jgi:hypothetical protein
MATSRKKKLPAENKILPGENITLPKGAERPEPKPKAEAGPAVTLPSPRSKSGAEAATVQAERPGNAAAVEFFRSQKPASDRPVTCPECKFDGKLGDFRELQLGEAGTGWSWYCPKCGWVVLTYVFVL